MTHFLQLYENQDFLVDKVVEFVLSGGSDAPALLVVTPEHATALRRRLGADREQVLVLDAAATLEEFMVDGVPDEQRFHSALDAALSGVAVPGRSTRAFGEMVAVLWERGMHEAAVRVEQLWNRLLGDRPVDLLCAYPLGAFADPEQTTVFLSICAEHGHTLPAEAAPGELQADQARYVAELQQQAVSLGAALTRATILQERLEWREREFEDFCENAAEALHRVGPDGTILWANQAELEMLGYEAHEYIGHNIAEFHVDTEALEDVLDRLGRGEEVRNQRLTMRARDGTVRHLVVFSSAHFEDGRFVSTRCFMRDVTDTVLLREERQARLDEMAEASRRKDEFLAMLAHELRNPLTPIHHALQILQQRSDPAALDMASDIMQRQLDHMVRLVDDLLDVTRITRGVIEMRKEPVELSLLVQEAVEATHLLSGDRTIEVDVSEHPLFLHGDPTRLHQVVGNLLHNACKFTRKGGRIRLTLAQEGDQACLRVQDDGIGIPANQLGSIFEMFVQGGSGSEHPQGGLGIGLTLVKTLTELHGGTVEASSAGLDQGSEFVVRLPIQAQAEAQTPPEAEHVPTLRVLVVDDNQDSADSLAELLQASGYEAHTAYDGPEAVVTARRVRPDVVLLDLGLPTLDGHEVARRIREQPWGQHPLLLAWTGWGQEEVRERSRKTGFDRHLVKPADYPVLMEMLAKRASDTAASVAVPSSVA